MTDAARGTDVGRQELVAVRPSLPASVRGVRVTAEVARRFLVARHSLAPARSLAGGSDAVREFFTRFGSLQFDPIAVAGRSHDLVLHARIADYDPAWCDSLYERREIFEAVNKGLSLVATDEYPWFRAPWSRKEQRVLERSPRGRGARARPDPRGGATLVARFRAPQRSVDRLVRSTHKRRPRRARGIRVHRRARAGATSRQPPLLRPPGAAPPAAVLGRDIPLAEQLRHKLHSRYRAHGLLGASSGGDVFGSLGPAKPTADWPGHPGRTALRAELIESGALVPVEVEGVRGTRYVLENEVHLLEAPPEPPPSVAFLSPFDPLVWDRKLLASLFEFDYVWDLFHPPAKRRFGWYVLPILFRERFVGRFEPRIDRDAGASRFSVSGGRKASRRSTPTASSKRCRTRSTRTYVSPA